MFLAKIFFVYALLFCVMFEQLMNEYQLQNLCWPSSGGPNGGHILKIYCQKFYITITYKHFASTSDHGDYLAY